MTKSLMLFLGLGLLASGEARAQVKVGDAAPAMQFTEWFNHGQVDLKSLKGRVVAYVFVRLESTKSLHLLQALGEVRDELALTPVTFVAITNEPSASVKDAIEVEDITLPVGLDPTDAAAQAFGVQSYPAVFVQDPRARISFLGQPGTKQEVRDAVVEALRFAKPFPELPKSLRDVSKSLEKWELKKVLDGIDKAGAKKLDPADQQLLNDVKVLILELTRQLDRCADIWTEDENWPRAVVALTRLIEEHAGVEGAEKAREKLDALLAREDVKQEIQASVAFAKGERLEREQNWKGAQKAYESVAKQFPSTKAGEQAKGLAVLLETRAK
ncbi:MAG: redoxin domain-containing protein [Planctomycetes bacterium]|nr:redoxin domain-containing protein [Planctomycetota bacterium]